MIDTESNNECMAVAILSIAVFAFGRVSEIANYKMSDVTETEYGWTIKVGRRKNDPLGHGSVVQIPWSHVSNVKRWRDKYNRSSYLPIIAGKNGKRLTERWFHIIVRNTTEKYGWSGVTVHSLRASAASAALDAGIPPEVIASACGWKGTTMVMRYGQRARQESAQIRVHEAIRNESPPEDGELLYFGFG
jgi:integrase